MILTTCAACAAPLAHTAPRCVRCHTYAETLHFDDGATVDDLREAVTTLEDAAQIARRVFGGEHPLTAGIEGHLQNARKVLRARSASLE